MPKLTFLPFMTKVSLALTVLAGLVGLIFRGVSGGLGAAAGVAIACGMFVLSTLVVTWVESFNRSMMLPAALGFYATKLGVFIIVLTALGEWAGAIPMALGIATGVLGWVAGYAWWLWHAKIPYVEL